MCIRDRDDRSYDADAFINFSLDENGKATGAKMKPISDVTDFSFDCLLYTSRCV